MGGSITEKLLALALVVLPMCEFVIIIRNIGSCVFENENLKVLDIYNILHKIGWFYFIGFLSFNHLHNESKSYNYALLRMGDVNSEQKIKTNSIFNGFYIIKSKEKSL